MENKTEVTVFSNGVISYNEKQRFWFGKAKARDIKAGCILRMVDQAKRLKLC